MVHFVGAFFFAHGAEYEVGILLGNVFKFRLCAVKQPFAPKPSRTYGNLALVYVVSRPAEVLFHSEQHFDAQLLVGLQNIVHEVVGGIEEGNRYCGKACYECEFCLA